MFGFSYGELFLLLGATAALIGPKDLPAIARTAGRLAGRSIGYVQMFRGQFENVMQQSQANQVHKELKDTMQQLEAIRHEIRSISILNPGPVTRKLMDNQDLTSANDGNIMPPKLDADQIPPEPLSKENDSRISIATNLQSQAAAYEPPKLISKESDSTISIATNLQSQATAYERLVESQLKNEASKGREDVVDEADLLSVLPVSAESAGLLPNRKGDPNGSDVMLEAVLEAEVAQNAKQFFAQHQDQLKVK